MMILCAIEIYIFLIRHFNFIVQFDLPNDSFKHVGIKSFPTKVMFFQKKSEHIGDNEYSLNKIIIKNYDENTAENIYNEYIKPVIDMKNKLKSKLQTEQKFRYTSCF